MKMFGDNEIKSIVEEFLAKHFNFENVRLDKRSIFELKVICEDYGFEIGDEFVK